MLKLINEKIKEAMKAKHSARLNVFKMVKAELLNNEKLAKPKEELQVVKSYHKKLKKSLDLYSGASLKDLQNEIEVIEELLPKELSDESVVAYIEGRIDGLKDKPFGEIIKIIRSEVNTSNGKLLSDTIKRLI